MKKAQTPSKAEGKAIQEYSGRSWKRTLLSSLNSRKMNSPAFFGERLSMELGKYFFFLLVIICGAMLIAKFPRISSPLIVSYVFSLSLAPIVSRLGRIGTSRNLSIILLFILILVLIVVPLVKFIPALKRESEVIQFYIPKVERFLTDTYLELQRRVKNKLGLDLEDHYLNTALAYGQDLTQGIIFGVPKAVATLLEWILLVPLFTFFLLRDGRTFRRYFLKIVPNSIYERFYVFIAQFNKELGGYIFAKVLEAIILGTIVTVGLFAVNVRFAFMLGLVAGITNIIPYLGPILGIIPAILFALVEYGIGQDLLGVCILLAVANTVDLAVVFPVLVSKMVNLHPVVVVSSVLIGGQYLGVLGMIISIPVAAAVKLLLIEFYAIIYGKTLE